jgi:hypothetical protein
MPWDEWGISVRQEVKDLQGTLIGARWESFTGPSGPAGRGVLEVDQVTEHLGEAAWMIGVSIEKFQIDYQEVVSQLVLSPLRRIATQWPEHQVVIVIDVLVGALFADWSS